MVNSITISSDSTVWFATDAGLASYKTIFGMFLKQMKAKQQ